MNRMIKTSLSASLLALFVASTASAADLDKGGDPTSADYVSGRVAFQGLGVGVNIGGQFTNIDVADEFDGIGADGIVGGVHVEYLFAMGNFRVGPEVWGGLSNVNVELGGQDVLTQDYYYGGGIKAGYVSGVTLIYAKAGYELAKWDIGQGEADADVGRIVLGGGIDHMVSSNVSLGLEVDYLATMDADIEGEDITEWVDKSEGIRALLRATWRQ